MLPCTHKGRQNCVRFAYRGPLVDRLHVLELKHTTWNDVPFELKHRARLGATRATRMTSLPVGISGAAPVPRAVGPKPACSPALSNSHPCTLRAHLGIRQVLKKIVPLCIHTLCFVFASQMGSDALERLL